MGDTQMHLFEIIVAVQKRDPMWVTNALHEISNDDLDEMVDLIGRVNRALINEKSRNDRKTDK